MATKNGTTNETQIRELIEERIRAIDEKDLDRLMSRQAADVLTFDVLEPLQYTGSGTIRQRAESGSLRIRVASATRFATWTSRRAMMLPSAIIYTTSAERC